MCNIAKLREFATYVGKMVGLELSVDKVWGGYQITYPVGVNGGVSVISPTGTKQECRAWLEAFREGAIRQDEFRRGQSK